jgi:chorismate--pyruvate lyase
MSKPCQVQESCLKRYIPAAWRRWLYYSQSLTRRLEDRTQQPIAIELLQQAQGRLLTDEIALLSSSQHRTKAISKHRPNRIWANKSAGSEAHIREVCLTAGDTPLVVARTVWPKNSSAQQLLAQLGSRPLGKLLFNSDPNSSSTAVFVQRQIILLKPGCPLYALAQSAQTRRKLQSYWARKTLYRFYDQPLIVTEIFLPIVKHL